MGVLPLVAASMFAKAVIERELRVRSRRPLTIWLRTGVAALATLMAVSALSSVSRFGGGAADAGKTTLAILSWMALAFCVLEGGRCGADVISREKREGTLGFLILTELSGFEVVLGKFAAVSVSSFYALFALFPAMALTLPAGGVTAGEFWRIQAVLINTLFLSTAVGLWLSARHQDDTRAFLGALGWLAGLVLIPLLLVRFTRFGTWPNPSPAVNLWLAEASNYQRDPARFWESLLAVQLLAWLLLFLAGNCLSRGWQSEPGEAIDSAEFKKSGARYTIPSSLHSDPELDRKGLLEQHPIRWLAERHRESRALIWLAVILHPLFQFGTTFGLNLFVRTWPASAAALMSGIFTAGYLVASLAGHFILAVLVSRRMAEDRASGALEVLLATPVSVREIVLDRWWGFWRILRGPIVVASLLPAVIPILSYSLWSRGIHWPSLFIYQVLGAITYATNLLAVCWLAMWMGIRARSPAQAAGLTVVGTVLVPYIIQAVLGLVLRFRGPFTNGFPYFLFSIHTLVMLGYAVGLILWSRQQLLTRFHEGVSNLAGIAPRDRPSTTELAPENTNGYVPGS